MCIASISKYKQLAFACIVWLLVMLSHKEDGGSGTLALVIWNNQATKLAIEKITSNYNDCLKT